MDGGAWWVTVHGVAKSQTWLSDHFTSSLQTNTSAKWMLIKTLISKNYLLFHCKHIHGIFPETLYLLLPHLYNYQTSFGHDNIIKTDIKMLAKVRMLKLKPIFKWNYKVHEFNPCAMLPLFRSMPWRIKKELTCLLSFSLFWVWYLCDLIYYV